MKRAIYLTVLFLATLGAFASMANALEKTSTGFYWPIGKSDSEFNTGRGWWLSKDPDYFKNQYHTGVDMMTYSTDADVYAISDGEIIYISDSEDSWGSGNCALVVEHKNQNGLVFIAIYGHLQKNSVPVVHKKISAGNPIGKTGNWSGGIHLHFTIHDGSYDSMAKSGWGKMDVSDWPNQNTFTDPIAFIKNNSPGNLATTQTLSCRLVGNVAWYPANKSCVNAERWVFFQLGYPNGGQTRSDNSICFEEEYDMIMSLGGFFSNWQEIIYGYGSLEGFNECK